MLLRPHHELRAAVRLAGQKIVKLNLVAAGRSGGGVLAAHPQGSADRSKGRLRAAEAELVRLIFQDKAFSSACEPLPNAIVFRCDRLFELYERGLSVRKIARNQQTPDNETMFVDVVFDGPPGPVCGRFVEVENEHGRSVNIGEWVQRPDGYWALRISSDDLAKMESDSKNGRPIR
jgi:hypothetical protein